MVHNVVSTISTLDVGVPLKLEAKVEEKDLSKRPLIHVIIAWYMSILQQDLKSLGVTYSEAKVGYDLFFVLFCFVTAIGSVD